MEREKAARVRRLGAAAVRRKETDLTGGPHLSASGREGRGWLGPTWAERGRERKREELGRIRPKDQEGDFLNFFE